MADPVKITTEELKEFNDLKIELQKNIFEFGELYLEKMELDELYKKLANKETDLRKKTDELKQRELTLMEKISKKYGEGTLNVSTGTFTSQQKIIN